jgi:uncharacterized protein YbjQ (UPF0145 family)
VAQDAEPTAGQAPEIPAHALERLRASRGAEGGHGLFTSDLTVNEFLLVRECGFEPLGLVLGSSIYHIGYQRAQWSQNQEMQVLTQATYHARELAMSRMEEEADALRADGVIGVRLEVNRYEWGADLAEFMAVGTAVRANGGESWKPPHGKPFTSDLSGQDFWTLVQTGYRPLGLVMGNCVYHIAHQGLSQWMRQVGRNAEMPNFTQGLYDARELAMERMQAEAASLAAAGIVGVRIEEKSHGWDSHVIEFFAVGTAVAPGPQGAGAGLPAPQLVLPLTDS